MSRIDPFRIFPQCADDLRQMPSAVPALALRLCGPFIVYAIIVNLAIGFANKFTPQISVYFVMTGVVAAGGFFLIYFTIDDWFGLFLQEFSAWLK